MKIGFVQPEDEFVDGQDIGLIGTALGRDVKEMTWPAWALMVFLHFCMVHVIIEITKGLFNFIFMR